MRKSIAHRDQSIGLRQRPAIQAIVNAHLSVGGGVTVMKGNPWMCLPQPRSPQQKMRLHGMRDHQMWGCVFDYSPQCGNDSKIKASALGDNFNLKPKCARSCQKFIRWSITGTLTREGNDQIIDRRKVSGPFVQLVRRARKFEKVFCDCIDGCRFDEGKNFEGGFHWRSTILFFKAPTPAPDKDIERTAARL